jgi:hypothetical protein
MLLQKACLSLLAKLEESKHPYIKFIEFNYSVLTRSVTREKFPGDGKERMLTSILAHCG